MSTSTGIPTSTTILIAASTRIRLRVVRAVRENGNITLSTARGSLIEIRTHGSNMVNQSRVPIIEKTSEDKRLIQETCQVLTEEGEIRPVEMPGPQLLTEEGEIRLVGTPGAAEIRQRSNPGSRMLSTVQIEAETMPEWPVIVEAPVARACPHPVGMAAVEAEVVAVEVSQAEAAVEAAEAVVVAEVVVEEVVEAVEAAAEGE